MELTKFMQIEVPKLWLPLDVILKEIRLGDEDLDSQFTQVELKTHIFKSFRNVEEESIKLESLEDGECCWMNAKIQGRIHKFWNRHKVCN